MRTALVGVMVFSLAAPASAEIVLFWSTTGVNNASFQYSTALTNFRPYLVPPTPVGTVLEPGTYDLFLWGKFIETPEMPAYSQIYGLDLHFPGDAAVAENVAYRQNKTGSGAYKRWDGSVGLLLDSIQVAITARGVEFLLPPDTNNDLYYPATQEFLLGAARVTGDPGEQIVMALQTEDSTPPGLGIAMRAGADIPDPPVIPAIVTFVPEPLSGALFLCLGCILWRR